MLAARVSIRGRPAGQRAEPALLQSALGDWVVGVGEHMAEKILTQERGQSKVTATS